MKVLQLVVLTKGLQDTPKIISGTYEKLEEDEKCKFHSISLGEFSKRFNFKYLRQQSYRTEGNKNDRMECITLASRLQVLKRFLVSLGVSNVRRILIITRVASFFLGGNQLEEKYYAVRSYLDRQFLVRLSVRLHVMCMVQKKATYF